MDHQLGTAKHALISYSSSSSIITALDPTTDNSCVQHQRHNGSFISLRCRPTLTTLPPELLSKISYSLSLCDYSFLSRTCSRLHSHLFHPAELVLFLKTRYRLSIQSGSIIIFAYLANMQSKAPLLLERIFEDFFADSPLRLQEEQKWKLHCQQQRQQLNNNTYQLNQTILSRVDSGSNNSSENGTSLEYQRMDGIELHKAAEKARRQAKSDAVRMLGVLYALDKTHIGPSSSTNALVLSGACDPPEPAPPAPAPAPAPSTVTETKTATALETTTTSSSLPAFAPSSSFSDIAPAPIRHASSFSSYSTPSVTTTATTGDADKDETATPSFIYHAASSSLSASGLPSSSPRFQNGQGPPGRSHSYQEEDGQQDQDNVPRSRSTSLDYSDLAPQHHQHQHQYRQQHQGTTHTRNVRKRPSPSIPSKDGKMPSSSSSSWWESPLTQQHAHSESSRFSPTRAFSPTSTRHHLYHHYHHQRQRSPPSSSSSSSSTSLASAISSVIPGSTAQQSGGGGSATEGTASRGGPTTETAAISGVALPSPSQTTTPPTSFSSTSSSSISSSSTSSPPSSSATSFVVQDERRRSVDRRNKRHMNLRAMMKERALLGDREAMDHVEYSHELARRGCWPVDLDQDFGMGSYYHHHQRTFDERGSSRDYYNNAEVAAAFGMQEMNDLPMDVDGGVDTDEWMQCESTTPIPTMTKSSPSYLPVAPVVSLQQQTNNKNNTSSSSSSMEPQLPTVSSSLSIAGCSSRSFSFANWPVLPEREKDRENESAFLATPLGISVPLIETNTNGSDGTGRWNGRGNGSGRSGGDGGSLSSWRMGVTSELPSSSLFSQDVSFRHPRGGNNQQQQQLQSPRLRVVLPTNTTSNNTSTPAPSSTSTTTTTNATTTTGTQQKMQQILNRNDKIAFLTQYTDRMHQKLQALGIEDWGQGDIQRKKTYQLMIQHNDKTGEKDLVKFYLGRYGGSTTTTTSGDAGAGVQEPGGPLGLTLPLSVQQQQEQEQQGTPLVAQA